ncbi:protein Exd1 homolog [Episyrphus balteatus]|uniref:protein Exd1 homolog n=1 Tax=Episyrphus balteatus TaxID=286459 RepID=UPI00248568F5|nr:protein Exd1 homolog [Episyrphus balteatus]
MDLDNCEIGQKLIVELEDEILVGDLTLISKDKRLIELSNVREFNSGYVFTSAQCIPRPLIKSIKCCKDEDADAAESLTSSSDQENDRPKSDYLVPITCDELDRIQSIVSSSIYIFQVDQRYHKAITNLKQQSTIGLHIEPSNFGRHNRTSLLALTTCQNIYIFDLISLGGIFKDLKNILQARSPKKAVYNSNKIADNLQYKHNVQLEGIFDIFVAHCLISKQKALTEFDECVANYLNIPINYFQGDDELQVKIYDRPLPKTHLDVLSKKAAFLLKLYDHMVHEIMLKNFYKQCKEYSETFTKNECDVEVAMQMAPNSTHGIGCIGDTEWADLLERHLKL